MLDFVTCFFCIYAYDPKCILQEISDCSQVGREPIHRPLQGPQPGLRFICLLSNAWMGRTPPRPLGVYGARSHSSHKGIFSMDGCWISVGEECKKMKDILFHHDASVTLLYLVIYFTSFDTDKWYDLCDPSLLRDSIGFSRLYNLPRSVQAHHCPVPWAYSFLQLLIFGLWHTRLIWGS